MTSIDSSALGSSPLNPPAGIKLETPEQEQLYRATLEFERTFVQQMLKPMKDAGSMLGDDGADSSTSGYKDMANDQLTQAVLDAGGLGLASTLYGQMAESLGVSTAATTTDGAA